MCIVTDQNILKLQNYINNGSINFLIGSGLSTPFIPALPTDFENKLQEAEQSQDKNQELNLKKFLFTNVLSPNIALLKDVTDSNATLEKQKKFVSVLHSIIVKRKHNLLHRQINIFTTNYDLLLECALEACGIDYNCGFNGYFFPTYNSDNFKKTVLKRGMFLDSSSEIPCFNIIKLHGSISWATKNDKITLKHAPEIIEDFENINSEGSDFLDKYNNLTIINPNNKKFLDTVLLDIYSDLLRFYSSELEKQNSLLFVCGFSFNDAHIRRLTLKAANANPTLQIIILAYKNSEIFSQLQEAALNRNISVEEDKYDLDKIISLFHKIEGCYDKSQSTEL